MELPLDQPIARKFRRSRPIDGWALDLLTNYDAVSPGMLRFALGASPLRRQGVFLTLSVATMDGADAVADRLRAAGLDPTANTDSPEALIGSALMSYRVREIVAALYGPVQGLVGALNRLGDAPLPADQYAALVELLREPEHEARAKALQQLDKITVTRLTALRSLEPVFAQADLVCRFRSPTVVEQFQAAVTLIRSVVPHASDDALLASLKALGPSSDLAAWVRRWLAKGVFAVAPAFVDDEEWRGLRSAEAMLEAGARFSNCLKTKIPLVALGRSFYIEYRPEPVIIELAGLSHGQWLVEGLYGPKNGPVDRNTAQAIRRKLEHAGALVPAHLGPASRFNKAARLLHIGMFSTMNLDGFELDDTLRAEDNDDDELESLVRELEQNLALT
jgi:hypothetical protein